MALLLLVDSRFCRRMLVVPAAITTVVLVFLILSITEYDGSTTTTTEFFVHSFTVTNNHHRSHRQVLRVPRTRRTHYPFQAHQVQGSSVLSTRASREETQYEVQLEATRRRMLGGRVGVGPHPKSKSKSKSSNRISPFDTILQSRRTIQSFVPDLPAQWETSLEAAITSAVYAPNHKRTEPWKFYVLGPETIRQVCALQADLVTRQKGAKAGQAKYARWLTMPGWLVVTCRTTKSSDGMSDPTGVQREDYAAVCCAIQNLCLSLHQAGMGTKWTTGPVNFHPQFNTIVGINTNTDTTEDDKEEFVVGTIWFGTPADVTHPPPPPMKKKQLQDVLIKTK